MCVVKKFLYQTFYTFKEFKLALYTIYMHGGDAAYFYAYCNLQLQFLAYF